MRLVSYNILDGGEGRADALAAVIEARRPDVVGLVEAESLPVLERIAARLKMDFIQALGKKGASALLSRWPIAETINHAPLQKNITKSLLEARVIEPTGREWFFGVLHFHAHAAENDERIREAELADVLDIFARHRTAATPHLLLGDTNANSPVQQIDPAKCKKSTRQEWQTNGGHIPRRVIQRLLDEGYTDTLSAVDPAKASTLGTFDTEHPGQRVDFIFTWGFDRSKIKDAWIQYAPGAKDASDHYPVGAEVV
jgi:exodeoxyribonuclease III